MAKLTTQPKSESSPNSRSPSTKNGPHNQSISNVTEKEDVKPDKSENSGKSVLSQSCLEEARRTCGKPPVTEKEDGKSGAKEKPDKPKFSKKCLKKALSTCLKRE